MFTMSWTEPFMGPVELLRFRIDPRRRGLGHYEDVDGVLWDVYAIHGEYVNARRVGSRPDYYSTASTSMRMSPTATGPDPLHTWIPYAVEVVAP